MHQFAITFTVLSIFLLSVLAAPLPFDQALGKRDTQYGRVRRPADSLHVPNLTIGHSGNMVLRWPGCMWLLEQQQRFHCRHFIPDLWHRSQLWPGEYPFVFDTSLLRRDPVGQRHKHKDRAEGIRHDA